MPESYRFTARIPAAEGERFSPGFAAQQAGREIPVRIQGRSDSPMGEIIAVEAEDDGSALLITVEVNDDLLPFCTDCQDGLSINLE